MKHVVPTFLIWMIILCGTSSAQSATAILRLSADYRIAETDSLPVKVTLPGLHFEKHEHSEFEALEWQVRLHAPDKGEVPLFKDIPSADFVVHFPDVSPTVVHWLSGSRGTADDFQPHRDTLAKDTPLTLESFGGRSSDGVMPYFNLASESGGLIVAVGWPGDWRVSFTARQDGSVRVIMGLKKTQFRLRNAEQLCLPSVLLMPYKGSMIDGQNRFRRLMRKHFTPDHYASMELMPVAASVHGMLSFNDTTEASLIKLASGIEKLQLPIDTFWLDAGWNEGGFPGSQGNPNADTKRFPNGLAPVGKAARNSGFRFLAWFEPERVMRDTFLHREHSEWLLRPSDTPDALRYQETDGFHLLDLSNTKAREWMLNSISDAITKVGIAIYRQDCNLYPSFYWNSITGPDDVGLQEVRYVNGLYDFLDQLALRHPELIIDNCAAGGRRLDFEMMRRSVCLWRSDSCWDDAAYPRNVQNMTLGLSHWLPLHGLGAAASDNVALRSGMGSCASFAINYSDPASVDSLRTHLQRYLPVRRLFAEDFYPLTETSDTPSTWIAFQFHDPLSHEGLIQAFRDKSDSVSEIALRLHGLEPLRRYLVTNWDDDSNPLTRTGTELSTNGIQLNSEVNSQQAIVLQYRLAP